MPEAVDEEPEDGDEEELDDDEDWWASRRERDCCWAKQLLGELASSSEHLIVCVRDSSQTMKI